MNKFLFVLAMLLLACNSTRKLKSSDQKSSYSTAKSAIDSISKKTALEITVKDFDSSFETETVVEITGYDTAKPGVKTIPTVSKGGLPEILDNIQQHGGKVGKVTERKKGSNKGSDSSAKANFDTTSVVKSGEQSGGTNDILKTTEKNTTRFGLVWIGIVAIIAAAALLLFYHQKIK